MSIPVYDIDKDEIKLDENDQNNVENIAKFIYPIESLYVFEAISFLICFLFIQTKHQSKEENEEEEKRNVKVVIIFVSIL